MAESITVPVDIINVRVPGYANLQQIRIDAQGRIAQILPMGEVLERVSPSGSQVLNVAGDWISLGGGGFTD